MAFEKKQKMNNHHKHSPVLKEDTLNLLDPKPGESYLDLTAGFGGHARAVLDKTRAPRLCVLVDRDEEAIRALADQEALGARLIHSDFLHALETELSSERFDMILLDLGVSSVHLDNSERGFSFRKDGPLDMRMDRRQVLSAEQIVNDWTEPELIRIFKEFGEEHRAKRIARSIIEHRPIRTTLALAEVVTRSVGRSGPNHPATRVFQAIRIAVNDELGQLSRTLGLLPNHLNPGGRLAVISFHSLEDRLVKHAFKELADQSYDAQFQHLTRSPILGQINDVHNPRARSAKLRAVVKIKRKGH